MRQASSVTSVSWIVVSDVESALERHLSRQIMAGPVRPQIRRLKVGETLVEQDSVSDSLFLLLDGVLRVEIDGNHWPRLDRVRCLVSALGWRAVDERPLFAPQRAQPSQSRTAH
jgi:hypothetical protein